MSREVHIRFCEGQGLKCPGLLTRTLAALGVPRSVYYAWKRPENLEDQVGKPCRVYEVLPADRAALCNFALQYPKIGYRKLPSLLSGSR